MVYALRRKPKTEHAVEKDLWTHNDFGYSLKNLFRHLVNVLLHRIQNMEKDQENNSSLFRLQ